LGLGLAPAKTKTRRNLACFEPRQVRHLTLGPLLTRTGRGLALRGASNLRSARIESRPACHSERVGRASSMVAIGVIARDTMSLRLQSCGS